MAVISAGLPNISGIMMQRKTPSTGTTGLGAILAVAACYTYENNYQADDATATLATGETTLYTDRVHFNAQNSSSVYGASNTVQPPALVLIPQIRY